MTPLGRLNEAYTFSHFVTGDSNRFAYEAARRVVALPGRVHNPLCIHGGVGFGKTHLATAVVLALRERLGDAIRVLYAEDLLDGHADERDLLVRSSRGAKLLFVDDVQLLAREPAAVDLLLRVLDVMLAGGGQVILTCDLPPAAVPGLAVPLKSRFEAGLATEILTPDGTLRREIVARKAATLGRPVAPEVAAFIAESEGGSVRALEGALNRARVFASSARVELSLGVARRALARASAEAGAEVSVTLDAIARAVGTAFGLSARALRSRKRRDRTSALARQVAMYLARRHSGKPLAEIWADYGWRDHSSAAHACAALRARLEGDPDLADRVSRLDLHFGGSAVAESQQESR